MVAQMGDVGDAVVRDEKVFYEGEPTDTAEVREVGSDYGQGTDFPACPQTPKGLHVAVVQLQLLEVGQFPGGQAAVDILEF